MTLAELLTRAPVTVPMLVLSDADGLEMEEILENVLNLYDCLYQSLVFPANKSRENFL